MHRTTRSKTHRQTSWTWCAARSVSIEREACGFSMSAVVGGSLSLHAAREYGARVVGITISAEQKAFVDAKVRALGLEDWVEIRLQDYREIPDGPFDAVASIEMGEHVGEDNYPTYVKALHDNVIAGGRVLIQQMSRTGPHPRGEVRSSSRSSRRTCTCGPSVALLR